MINIVIRSCSLLLLLNHMQHESTKFPQDPGFAGLVQRLAEHDAIHDVECLRRDLAQVLVVGQGL